MNLILVFLGGGLGSILRYFIGTSVQRLGPTLPWATFISNVVACIIFASTLWWFQGKTPIHYSLKLFVLVGFCGGLSTFSTFGYETFVMFKEQLFAAAILNILVSTALCLFIFYLFYISATK